MSNVNKAKHVSNLEQKLNINEVYYLHSIASKLNGELTTKIIINEDDFPRSFPDGTSFYDFISNKLYNHEPHTRIGEGKFGKVFKLDFQDVHFVLKEILLPNLHSFDLVVEEIRALQRVIESKYAVQLFAAAVLFDKSFTLERLGVAYILYPYIEGRTLDEYHEEQHTDDEKRAIYSKIATAVHHLHTIGILHSDIKPANIWIPTDPNIPPFLLDFGLVQSLKTPIARNIGTPFFWSIERYKAFLSNNRKQQAMKKGINWIATVKSFTGNINNNVPINNPSNHPNLSSAFRRLYRTKTENTIRRREIKEILKRGQSHVNTSSSNNSNNNSNNNTRKNKKRKTHHNTQNKV
jgi:tRNA A-37 threonylcarbamoyl transferase component Bud32